MTNKPPYADQHTVQRNRLPSHAPLRAYASKREALSRKLSSLAPPSSATYTLPLTPAQWDFRLDASPEQAPEIIHGLGFDTAEFGTIHVPRSWEAAGHGQPIYLNHRYPFKLDPPRVPADNPVGSYQRRFSLPRAWQNRRTILVLDGVGSACTVYLDGVEVGYSQDSKLPAEFDVTKLVASRPSAEHTLSVRVYRWSDGSYLEDQDQWWLSGIQRHCWLYSKPSVLALADWSVRTDITSVSGTRANGGDAACVAATVEVDVSLHGAAADAPADFQVRASLHGPFVVRDLDAPLPRTAECWSDACVVEAASAAAQLTSAAEPSPPHHCHEAAGHCLGESAPGAEDGERLVVNGARAHFHAAVPSPSLWTAETPSLYSLVLELVDERGATIDVETCLVGLRSVTIEAGLLQVNGSPLTVFGVNRHEHCPHGGKAVDWPLMLLDATMIKQSNFNAVRTAHYPNCDAWYDLCSAVGLYIVDEANLETHGFFCWGDEGYLAKQPSWRVAMLSRLTRMVRRDKNHPCVVTWSLGNESGYGATHDAMADWCRRADPSRPVQYESCGGACATDIICPMYPPVEMVRKAGASIRAQNRLPNFGPTRRFPRGCHREARPLILCEFAHAMGNSTGNYEEWWRLFRSLPYAQGGFIWDWADQGLPRNGLEAASGGGGRAEKERRASSTGRPDWAYGGDFGESAHDAHFCINGLVFPDRAPHPALAEVKHVHRPVDASIVKWRLRDDKGPPLVTIRITNRYDVVDLSHIKLQVILEFDGVAVASGTPRDHGGGGPWRSLSPGSSADVELELSWFDGFFHRAARTATEAFCMVHAVLAADTSWAPAGHELASIQLAIPGGHSPAPPPQLTVAHSTPLELSQGDVSVTVSGRGDDGPFSLTLSRATAAISSYSVGGVQLLEGGELNLWRAPTDNDNGSPLELTHPAHETIETIKPFYLRAFYSHVGPLLRHIGLPAAILSWTDAWKRHGLHRLEQRRAQVGVVHHDGDGVILECTCVWQVPWWQRPWGRPRAEHTMLVAVSPNGAVHLQSKATVRQFSYSWEAPFSLPRIGQRFALPKAFTRARWYGRGPHENYPDRCTGAHIRRHETTLDELFTPYLVPSENGHRGGTRWLVLERAAGDDAEGGVDATAAARGLCISSAPVNYEATTFGFSASKFSVSSLERAKHPADLTDEPSLQLNVDHRIMGVGGDIGWGRSVWDDYIVPRGTYQWALRLHTLGKGGEASSPTVEEVRLSELVAARGRSRSRKFAQALQKVAKPGGARTAAASA